MSGGMLTPPGPIRVLVATKPVDFRKGMEPKLDLTVGAWLSGRVWCPT